MLRCQSEWCGSAAAPVLADCPKPHKGNCGEKGSLPGGVLSGGGLPGGGLPGGVLNIHFEAHHQRAASSAERRPGPRQRIAKGNHFLQTKKEKKKLFIQVDKDQTLCGRGVLIVEDKLPLCHHPGCSCLHSLAPSGYEG